MPLVDPIRLVLALRQEHGYHAIPHLLAIGILWHQRQGFKRMGIGADAGVSLEIKCTKDAGLWILEALQDCRIERAPTQGQHPGCDGRCVPIVDAKGRVHADTALVDRSLQLIPDTGVDHAVVCQ